MNGVWAFLGANKETIAAIIAIATFIVAIVKYFLDARTERQSIQIGFLVEIERLLSVIERHLAEYESFKFGPLIPFTTDFYDKQIQNVGKIEQSLIPDVIRFYGMVKFLNQIQASRAGYLAKVTQETYDGFYTAAIRGFLGQFKAPFAAHFQRFGIAPPKGA
jgi:hypothetical protein